MPGKLAVSAERMIEADDVLRGQELLVGAASVG